MAAKILRQNFYRDDFRVTQAKYLLLRPAHDKGLAFCGVGLGLAIIPGLQVPVEFITGLDVKTVNGDGELVRALLATVCCWLQGNPFIAKTHILATAARQCQHQVGTGNLKVIVNRYADIQPFFGVARA